jgi:hypothetical protein
VALPPRSSPLKEADLLIPDGEVKGEQLRQVFRRLLSQLNPFFDSINRFASSVSLSQNDRADLITANFTHGVPTAIRLQKLQMAKSAIVRNCSGATPIGTPTVQMQPQAFVGALPVVLVTIFFTNPAAVGVRAMVELREEGPSLSAAPVTDGVSIRYQQVSAQTIPTGADTVVNFDTIITDSDSAVTPGVGWRFVVPPNKGGLYFCTASVTVLTPAAPVAINHLRLACRLNTAVTARLDGQPVAALASVLVTREGVVPVFAASGDSIDFVLYQDSGGNVSTAASSSLILGTTCTIVRLLGY